MLIFPRLSWSSPCLCCTERATIFDPSAHLSSVNCWQPTYLCFSSYFSYQATQYDELKEKKQQNNKTKSRNKALIRLTACCVRVNAVCVTSLLWMAWGTAGALQFCRFWFISRRIRACRRHCFGCICWFFCSVVIVWWFQRRSWPNITPVVAHHPIRAYIVAYQSPIA